MVNSDGEEGRRDGQKNRLFIQIFVLNPIYWISQKAKKNKYLKIKEINGSNFGTNFA